MSTQTRLNWICSLIDRCISDRRGAELPLPFKNRKKLAKEKSILWMLYKGAFLFLIHLRETARKSTGRCSKYQREKSQIGLLSRQGSIRPWNTVPGHCMFLHVFLCCEKQNWHIVIVYKPCHIAAILWQIIYCVWGQVHFLNGFQCNVNIYMNLYFPQYVEVRIWYAFRNNSLLKRMIFIHKFVLFFRNLARQTNNPFFTGEDICQSKPIFKDVLKVWK